MNNSYEIVRQFESAVAKYAGSPYAVAVDSCSSALFLCCSMLGVKEVTLPKRTYPSVPCSVINAGGNVRWRDDEWNGAYYLSPYPIVDCALRFTSGMYQPGTYQCLSFHYKKILPIGRGGMVLTDDERSYKWLKRARFNGRNECPLDEDVFDMIGWNMYMEPDRAARGLSLLFFLPEHNEDLQETYPDLSKYEVYQNRSSTISNSQ